MARRIVRTALQLTLFSALLGLCIFLLDTRYRVLPTAIHNRFPDHRHHGSVITDIQLVTCSKLSPLSSCKLSDDWTRIEKDLYLDSWVSHAYLHVKRKKETELIPRKDKIVVDVKVGRIKPVAGAGVGVKGDEEEKGEWESRKGGVWIKRQFKEDVNAVTAVDVLFGADAVEVREGWALREGSLTVGDRLPRLTARRGPHVESKKPVVRMRKDHTLKIIQVSDLHLSTGVGACREAEPPSTVANCEADPRTLDFIARILDDEKPDIAILTGDQVDGDTAPDAQTAIFKFAEPFIKRKIPYATILGNHDDKGNLPRDAIMELTASLPYSLSELGDRMGPIIKDHKGREQREGGAGNYYVEVLAHTGNHQAVTLYMMDTHSYTSNPKRDGYDWIKSYQIEWFNNTHARLKPEHDKYSFIHLDLAFIHIPLPEYRTPNRKIIGGWREPPTAPWRNSGFKDAIKAAGIAVVTAGHDHANDYCLFDDGVWLCYAGGSGFGGYGGYGGYHRRVRLFEVDANNARVKTWKRLEWEDRGPFDEQIVVDQGKVVEP